jgi:hypothetical protein
LLAGTIVDGKVGAVAAGVGVCNFGDCFGLIGGVDVGVGEVGVSRKFSNMFLYTGVCCCLLDCKDLFDIFEICVFFVICGM